MGEGRSISVVSEIHSEYPIYSFNPIYYWILDGDLDLEWGKLFVQKSCLDVPEEQLYNSEPTIIFNSIVCYYIRDAIKFIQIGASSSSHRIFLYPNSQVIDVHKQKNIFRIFHDRV